MRIRTIKPEFWTHPVMVRQDDATKLLAIGLLNYADDHGFFYATPAMVRAALRALDEDSTIVRASLARLTEIGFIEMREHSTHGELGRIVSFLDHQRVDRPSPSKIKDLWDSTKIRRKLDDHSSLDQGKGSREQGTGKGVGEAPQREEKSPVTSAVLGRSAHVQPENECPELMTEAHAVTAALNQRIPNDFARFVYADWHSRGGKDATGTKVQWTPYIVKRWGREGAEWRAGKHRGQNGGKSPNGSKSEKDNWPSAEPPKHDSTQTRLV